MTDEQSESPIVIYGAPRSGTTYLNRILNEHPEIFISSETRVFAWLQQSLNVSTMDDRFFMTDREPFRQYLRDVYPALIRDFYRRNYPPSRYWGDKNPHYADKYNAGCLDTIAEVFPGSHFIHIVRDGRDVVASLIRKRFANGDPWTDFNGAHRLWLDHLAIGCTFGRGLPSTQYFEVRYENLVRDDVGVAAEIFDFLGIAMGPEVTAFCAAQNEKRTILSEPTRDLDNGATVSDWAEALTRDQQLRSLELLWDGLIAHGYESQASLESNRAAIGQEQLGQADEA